MRCIRHAFSILVVCFIVFSFSSASFASDSLGYVAVTDHEFQADKAIVDRPEFSNVRKNVIDRAVYKQNIKINGQTDRMGYKDRPGWQYRRAA